MRSIRHRSSSAFTLVEMLVSLTVLLILGVIIAKITGATALSIHTSNRIVDSSAQAQITFGRIGLDLSALIKRADVDFSVATPTAAGGSSSLIILSVVSSEGSPSGGNRNASLVSYQVAANVNNPGPDGVARPCLVRAGKALGWSSVDFMGLDSNGLPVSLSGTLPTALAFGTTDYDILSPGVLLMVIGFQLYPDNQSVTLADNTSTASGLADGSIVYSPPIHVLTEFNGTQTNFTDASRIAAIVVGLVAIDTDTLRLLNAAQINQITHEFSVPKAGKLPVQAWSSIADGLVSSLKGSVPLPALQTIHVFERVFPITPFETRLQ